MWIFLFVASNTSQKKILFRKTCKKMRANFVNFSPIPSLILRKIQLFFQSTIFFRVPNTSLLLNTKKVKEITFSQFLWVSLILQIKYFVQQNLLKHCGPIWIKNMEKNLGAVLNGLKKFSKLYYVLLLTYNDWYYYHFFIQNIPQTNLVLIV